VEKIRTVSDTKREFYTYHTRPINSIYRAVVDELITEMHLLSVNLDFKPDPLYYLGVVTAYEQFMAGYTPIEHKNSIFNALCKAVGGDPETYRQQAEALVNFARNHPAAEVINWLASPTPEEGVAELADSIKAIASQDNFKYSRLFAIGLYTLIIENDSELLKDDKKREETFQQVSKSLNLPLEKMKKDLDLYRSNLEKMTQKLNVLEETLEASRKKTEKSSTN
jgi:photosystem II biogenesis protein Psp29